MASDRDWPLGALDLKVLDLAREVEFYEWFGLSRISGDAASAVMAVDGATAQAGR